jgi:hypothetical protein
MACYTKLVSIQAVFEIRGDILIVFSKMIDSAKSTVYCTFEPSTFSENEHNAFLTPQSFFKTPTVAHVVTKYFG